MWQRASAENLTVYLKNMDVSFSCVRPVIGNEFCQNIFKVVCGSTRLSPRGSTATLTLLWRNSWSIKGQKHENWRQFVNYTPAFRQASVTVHRHPFTLHIYIYTFIFLREERHCESKLSCLRLKTTPWLLPTLEPGPVLIPYQKSCLFVSLVIWSNLNWPTKDEKANTLIALNNRVKPW